MKICKFTINIIRMFVKLNVRVSIVLFLGLMKLWQVIECKHLFICFQGHGHILYENTLVFSPTPGYNVKLGYRYFHSYYNFAFRNNCECIYSWSPHVDRSIFGQESLHIVYKCYPLLIVLIMSWYWKRKTCFAFQTHSSLHLQVKIQFVHCVYF